MIVIRLRPAFCLWPQQRSHFLFLSFGISQPEEGWYSSSANLTRWWRCFRVISRIRSRRPSLAETSLDSISKNFRTRLPVPYHQQRLISLVANIGESLYKIARCFWGNYCPVIRNSLIKKALSCLPKGCLLWISWPFSTYIDILRI